MQPEILDHAKQSDTDPPRELSKSSRNNWWNKIANKMAKVLKTSPENNSKAENKTKLEQRRAKKWEILEEKWKCLFSLENPTSDNHSLRKTLREEKRNYNFWTEENCASPKTTEMKEM